MDYTTQIHKFIGKQYTKVILSRLVLMGIKNPSGEPYTKDHIQKIAKGIYPNEAIENEILFLLKQGQRKLEKKQKLQLQLQQAATQTQPLCNL